MSFDDLIVNPGRLRILTALAVEPALDFVSLRSVTRLTDGNLSCHAKRLASAGLVNIDKTFRDGKPITNMKLTPQGRLALESHVRRLMAAMSHRRLGNPPPVPSEPAAVPVAVVAAAAPRVASPVDDWVD